MTYRKLHTHIEPDQSAVIPYRVRGGVIEVLLITSRGKGKWMVPKGSIEEESHESAVREAYEEAGVKGLVSPVSLGCYRHGRAKSCPVVEVFLMRVDHELRSWPEKPERTRQWVPLEEAYTYIQEEGLRSILDEAASLMNLSSTGEVNLEGIMAHPAIPSEE